MISLVYNIYWWFILLYPNNIKKTYSRNISHAGRGLELEKLINETNKYYLVNNIAVIYQKPTPIGIQKIKYEGKSIKTTGFLKSKSTLDYVGLYKGKYLDFDAKSTLNKTSFPLGNISEHQIKHIVNVINHGGIAFLIIGMNNAIYFFKGEDLIDFINNHDRKSIPYDYIKENAFEIKIGINPRIDYLKIIEKIYF